MATIETPPTRPEDRREDINDVPELLVQLQDDLAHSRLREAFWMSLCFHLVIAILLATSPKWADQVAGWFGHRAIIVANPGDLVNQRNLTYLDLPPDLQKVTKTPNTDIVSDKNRIAMSKTPSIDRKALQKILDSSRPGAPGSASMPNPQMRPSPQQQMAQQAMQQGRPMQQGGSPMPQQNQSARLEGLNSPRTNPNPGNVFSNAGAMSAGRSIEQAARAAASRSGGSFSGGGGGDYGMGTRGRGAKVVGNMEVLSDTMGVDFGPYLSRVLHDVKLNWYNIIPEVAKAPFMKKGKVAIEFAIMKDGSVRGMVLRSGSGDVSLDRAAWGGITASNPFPALPREFRGNYLQLRFRFYYNPETNELQ